MIYTGVYMERRGILCIERGVQQRGVQGGHRVCERLFAAGTVPQLLQPL